MRQHEVVAANDGGGSVVAGLAGNRKIGRLPFTVRVVRTEEELGKAVRIRHAAYARHVPAFAAKLGAPEPLDRDPGAVVLLAQSKMDGSPLGTMRIQTNRHGPLALEQSVMLPDWLQDRGLVQAARLGVETGHIGNVVKVALFKAFFFYCIEAGIDYMVIAGRPPLDRMYEALGFQDVFPGRLVPLAHAANLPHRIMALEVATLQQRWADTRHRLYDFFFDTQHADIDLEVAQPGRAASEPLPQRQVVNA